MFNERFFFSLLAITYIAIVKNFFRFLSLNSGFISPKLKDESQCWDAIRVPPGAGNLAINYEYPNPYS